jgi:uncharacterized protein (TIGR02145 family)
MLNKKTILLALLLILFAGGLFISQNPTLASVVSNNYRHYKAKYKNQEDKRNYQKIKNIKKENKQLYFYWKAICDAHKYDTDAQFKKLSKSVQEMCNQYYSYKGYRKYIYYRDKRRGNDNDGNDDNNNNSGGTDAVVFVCGTDTVEDADGNEYDTVEVGDQCWMAENIRVGTKLAAGTTEPSNNETIEKWCYNNDSAICATDGGLYSWDEAMQYSEIEGAQGICPTDWHIPKDSELYALENYLKDAEQTCDASRNGSYDCSTAGTKLRPEGSSNLDFPLAGNRYEDGSFDYRTSYASIWSSSESDDSAWVRDLSSEDTAISRYSDIKAKGFSIRCLKD